MRLAACTPDGLPVEWRRSGAASVGLLTFPS